MMVRVSLAGQERLVHIELKSPEPCLGELRNAIYVLEMAALTKSKHQIRFLAAGKLLEGSRTPLSKFGDVANSVIHCVISDRQHPIIGTTGSKWAGSSPEITNTPDGPLPMYTGHQHQSSVSRGRNLLGRLQARLSNMFYVQRIANVETRRSHDMLPFESIEQDGPNLINMNEIDEHQAESDADFDRLPGDHDFDEGTFSDWASGFTYGFFLGLIMLLLAMDSTIAFPRQWGRGAQLGVACNFLFGTFLVWNKVDI
jgi:hypothetical protein